MSQPKGKKARIGRPPLSRAERRGERVTAFLTRDQWQQLYTFAQANGQSMSGAAQYLIRRGLTHETDGNHPQEGKR